jgi:hypothetical protein
MPKRSRKQIIGDRGEAIVRNIIDAHACWLARSQDHDFGVDLEAELSEDINDHQELTGKLIKIQVKTKETCIVRSNFILISIKKSYLNYVYQFHLPVILVVVDIKNTKIWYLWLQDWILRNENNSEFKNNAKSVTLRIPVTQFLQVGLEEELKQIAREERPTTMVVALRHFISIVDVTRNSRVMNGILDLLTLIDEPSRDWIIQKTIDDLVQLGPNVALWQSAQFLPQVFSLIDRLGDKLDAQHLVKMVARDESYSRVGIYSLARLYDKWLYHAQNLRLSDVFKGIGIAQVAWYCNLREQYSFTSMELWGHMLNNILPDSEYDGLILILDKEKIEYIMRSWPNRGDSVYLDILEKTS